MSSCEKFLQGLYFHKLIGTLSLNVLYNKIFNKESEYLMNVLYNDVMLNGCVITKLAQWIITRYNIIYNDNKPKWLSRFNDIYENCEEHSFNYTKKIFEQEVGEKYENYFTNFDEDAIASGSIGQVYRATTKDGKDVAIKVQHPNMEIQSTVPIYLLKSYNNLFKKFSKLCSYAIPFDLETFFDDIKKQIDFRYEYDNMVRYREMYKDNHLIIIPEPILRSEKILITSYEEGDFFEDLDISDYIKNKIVQLLVLFIRDTSIIHQFMHSDLHQGNWKVRKIDKEYALVIYDLGLCFEFEKQIIQDFWYYWEKSDKIELSKLFTQSISYKPDDINLEDIEKDIYNNLIDLSYKPLDASTTISETIQYLNSKKVIMNSYWMTLCITISLVEDFTVKYDIVNKKNMDPDRTAEDVFKVFYLNFISFCETNNVFNELKNHMEKSLERANIKFDTLFSNIEYKLNADEENNEYFKELDMDDNKEDSNNKIELSI